MTKTEQLNALFSEWRENREEYKGQFIKDGIIDETLYNTQKPKLLFIGKEANDGKGKDWDYRDHIMDGVKYKYNLRVAEWAYGIQNNFPAFDNIYRSRETLTESAKKIAIIDVKKNGG